MKYDRLTFSLFKEALKGNKYASIAGARRAVGRATTFSESEKEAARKAIDAHFGETGKSTKKTPVKKIVKKAVKTTKRQPTTVTATTGTTVDERLSHLLQTPVARVDLEDSSSVATQLKIAERAMASVAAGLNAVTSAKKEFPEAELAPVAEEMGVTMHTALSLFRQIVDNVKLSQAATVMQRTTTVEPEVTPVRQRAEALFRESTPSGVVGEG